MKYKKVPGFPDYKINKVGQIVSTKFGNMKMLKPHFARYVQCTLSLKGQYFPRTIHRLVWLTFNGEIPVGLQINHKDGNKHNNDLGNLELLTPGDNQRHAYSNGLKPILYGFDSPNGKLKLNQIKSIKHLLKKKIPHGEIARLFNVTESNISYIKTGKIHSYVKI